MKRNFILFVLITISISVFGQSNAYNAGYGFGCYQQGKMALCNGNYDEAFEYFLKGVDYHPINYEGVGICYELGFGVSVDQDEAWDAYARGANAGDYACKSAIQRINQYGYYTKANRSIFLRNLRNSMSAQGFSSGGNSGSGSYGGSSGSSSSSVYSTCRICGGSGVCTGCGGKGGEWRDTGYYTGSNTQSWIACGSCRGSKRCFNCHGTGRQ